MTNTKEDELFCWLVIIYEVSEKNEKHKLALP